MGSSKLGRGCVILQLLYASELNARLEAVCRAMEGRAPTRSPSRRRPRRTAPSLGRRGPRRRRARLLAQRDLRGPLRRRGADETVIPRHPALIDTWRRDSSAKCAARVRGRPPPTRHPVAWAMPARRLPTAALGALQLGAQVALLARVAVAHERLPERRVAIGPARRRRVLVEGPQRISARHRRPVASSPEVISSFRAQRILFAREEVRMLAHALHVQLCLGLPTSSLSGSPGAAPLPRARPSTPRARS